MFYFTGGEEALCNGFEILHLAVLLDIDTYFSVTAKGINSHVAGVGQVEAQGSVGLTFRLSFGGVLELHVAGSYPKKAGQQVAQRSARYNELIAMERKAEAIGAIALLVI